jgi:hypothetical protein
MKRIRLGAIPVLLTILGLCSASAQAQVTKEQLEAARARLQAAHDFYNKLSDERRKMLSGGALNFFHMIQNWSQMEKQALADATSLRAKAGSNASVLPQLAPLVQASPGPVQVSNPATDFEFGPSEGFTQSETSTAWCGQNVVVGFNDSGSFWESFVTHSGAYSKVGYATSGNQGKTFLDRGFLPSAALGFLLGDPVVACTDASTFYFSSLFSTFLPPFTVLTAISVSKSTDAGASFGAPVIAASKDAATHFLDKDWLAINPANPQQIAVTYTDFDLSFTVCLGERTAIELVGSSDGGNTWSAPQVVFEVCTPPNSFPQVQGSQVAFSPSGAVNVAFELYLRADVLPPGRLIEFMQAPSLGAPFGATVAVANVLGVGDGFALQGGIRALLDLQGMAVDRSGLSTNGNIYIVFHDSTNFTKVFGGNPFPYGYADAMIVRSRNNGATWSAPVQVNTNHEPLSSGLGTDSYMPGIAVDNSTGEIGVCWYDRRNDPLNYRLDRFCGHSFDAGESFTNFRVTPQNFPPIHGTDESVNPSYFGDYDNVATDTLKRTRGFIGAFQVVEVGQTPVPNPDVKANNFN